MKKAPTMFLQAVVVLISIAILAFMIRFPLTEGRATNLDLLSIYADSFIVYGYLVSIAFFVAMYQVFRLLGYVRQSKIFSPDSVKALRIIRFCAIVFGVAILTAVVYIRIFHGQDDDPAGFIAIAIMTTFISIIVAAAASVLGQILQDKIKA